MRLVRTANLKVSNRYLAYEAEESLLHTIMQICRRVSLNGYPFHLTVRIEEEEWKKSVSAKDAVCTLFVFDLYEYLFRASLNGKRAVEVTIGKDESKRISSENTDDYTFGFDLPEIPYCGEFLQFYHEIGDKIRGIYAKVAGKDRQDSDFSGWDHAADYEDEDGAYRRLRRLAQYAIFGESKTEASKLNQACSFSPRGSTDRVLTYYHPRVLLQRLKMAIYMREEIRKQDGRHGCAVQEQACPEEELIWGNFPVFSSELRYTNNQFMAFGQDLYALDQRYGTISSCLYQRMSACSSVRPFPLVNTAEKLILDIRECDREDDSKIRILMVGSIDFGELTGIMDIFQKELEFPIFQRIELTAWSSLPLGDEVINENRAIHYCTVEDERVNLFEKGIMSFDIVFLIDPYLLYATENKAALTEAVKPDAYILTQKTIRNDIVHAAYESGQGYMDYVGKLSLKVKDFLQDVNLCKKSAQLSHLCILLSYSEQTELIGLSHGTQEVRKEIASQNCYTTLLRYSKYSNEPGHDDQESFGFLFRLHQWYKMTAPNLSRWSMEIGTKGDVARLDRLMYGIICKFLIEKDTGKWVFVLSQESSEEITSEASSKKELSDADKNRIAEHVKRKIEYGFESGLHMEDSIRLARQSFANLLISRSTTRKHLLYARSVIYGKPSEIEVKWSGNGDPEEDINEYNRTLRRYHSRYPDYLLLCAVDKSAQNLESISRIYQLSNALGREDGFRTIKELAEICEQEYNSIVDHRMKKYFLRIIEQANYLWR